MKTIVITGQIGTGKSTVARNFAHHGAFRFDADAAVHRLLASHAMVRDAIVDMFGDAVITKGETGRAIDRGALARIIHGNDDKRAALEGLLHPFVYEAESRFLADAFAKNRYGLCVCEMPLYFETHWPRHYDAVVVVHVSDMIQKQRVMRRKGMSEDVFRAIVARQCPKDIQLRSADFAVHTGSGKGAAMRKVMHIMQQL